MRDFIALVLALIVLAAIVHTIRSHGYLPRNRERHMRIRLHLRRRPGPGHASGYRLWWSFGRLASYRHSRQTRPGLTSWERRRGPESHSVYLGRAHHRRSIRIPADQHILIFAPPRTGKTQLLSRIIAHYPGPVLSTTTRADVYLITRASRAKGGRPLAVFNPQGIGGDEAASTFQWSPIEGCEDRAVAIRRADGFANALPADGENLFFKNAARSYLRAMFHAAALVGGDMRLVARWALTATKGGARDAESILRVNGAGEWADELAQLRGAAERTNATNEMTMTQVLGFMADPNLAISALPGPYTLDLEAFLRQSGTLYLIADPAGNDDSPLSPLFAAMANELNYAAGMIGQASDHGRLDPPLLIRLVISSLRRAVFNV